MINDANNPKHNLHAKTIILAGFVLFIVLYFADVINIAKNLYGIIFPLLLGAGIAYVLNILVVCYEKVYFPKSSHKLVAGTRRGVCVLLAIMTIVLVVLLFLRILIPQFAETIHLLAAGFPDAYNNAVVWAKQHADQIPQLQQKLNNMDMNGEAVLKRALELVGNWAFGTVSFIGTVFNGIVSFIIALVFGIYALFAKEELKVHFNKLLQAYMRADRRERLIENLRITDQTFTNYIVGQCKEAVILGSLCTIGMLIFSFPYAFTIGPIIGLTSLIPMVGAFIGATLGVILIVMIDPFKALLFILFIVILQQLEGNLIYPKVVGQSIGLPGIWVLAAITVGGGLLGIAGVILGVPIAATAYKLLGKSVKVRINRAS